MEVSETKSIVEEYSAAMHCEEFFKHHDSDTKYLFAMMIGVSARDDLGLDLTYFDAEHLPFSRRRRDFKPTLKVLQDEVVRRAALARIPRMPRPAQWSSEKLVDALTVKFPSKLSTGDIAFLRTECRKKVDAATERNVQDVMLRERDAGWKSAKSFLRLFHTIAELRHMFLLRETANGVTRDPSFWISVADKFNDKSWIPISIEIRSLEKFSEKMELPFLFPENLIGAHLSVIFGSVKHKLMDALNKSPLSQQAPLWTENGRVEQWSYEPCDVARKLVPVPGDDVVYLWELANRYKILGSCLSFVADDSEGDSAREHLAADCEESDFRGESTLHLENDTDTFSCDEDFIEAQQLLLRQVKLLNRM